MSAYRVLVCGSRDLADRYPVWLQAKTALIEFLGTCKAGFKLLGSLWRTLRRLSATRPYGEERFRHGDGRTMLAIALSFHGRRRASPNCLIDDSAGYPKTLSDIIDRQHGLAGENLGDGKALGERTEPADLQRILGLGSLDAKVGQHRPKRLSACTRMNCPYPHRPAIHAKFVSPMTVAPKSLVEEIDCFGLNLSDLQSGLIDGLASSSSAAAAHRMGIAMDADIAVRVKNASQISGYFASYLHTRECTERL